MTYFTWAMCPMIRPLNWNNNIQGGSKTDTQFYFGDNFGNSAPILTINQSKHISIAPYVTVTSRNPSRVYLKFFHPPHLYYTHYLAKQTLLLISCCVLFYWLNLSIDSIKMMCGCSSQVAMLDVSAAILDNSFKTSTPFTDTFIDETLWELLPLGGHRSLQFFHRLELLLPLGGRFVAERVPRIA